MNSKEFFDKVVQMRKMQKEYFKSRSSISLSNSKKLEKEIDDEIIRVENILKKDVQQKLLFKDTL